jgi:Raf kinase inhibitor-like YbhB/YbcL family protein
MTNLPPKMGVRSHFRGQVRRVLAVVVVVAAAASAGCGADDRELRPPSDSQTTTTTEAAALGSVSGPSDGVGTATDLALQLTSPDFLPAEAIPDRFTCQGDDVSPALQWANLPAGVTELAVVMVDLDADGFVHWVVTGIPPTIGGLPEGQLPEGAVAGPNSFGRTGWGGPCPPSGSGTHNYEFRLLALSGPPQLPTEVDPRAAVQQLTQLPTLAIATLTGAVTAAG